MSENEKKSPPKRFRLPKLYKRLLLIAIVVGPMWWLLFTEDGKRRTDMVMLTLFGDEPLYLNLKVLDSHHTEAQLMQLYPDLKWQCTDRQTHFGTRLCTTTLGSFNDIPSKGAALFFRDHRVNAVKVDYNRNHHTQLYSDLRKQLGPPMSSAENPMLSTIIQWRTNTGFVIMKRKLTKGEKSTLFWLSPWQMAYQGTQ